MPKSPKRDKGSSKVKDIWLQLLTRQRDMEIAAQENADKALDEALAAAEKGDEPETKAEGGDEAKASGGDVETKEGEEGGEGGEEGGAAKELTPEEIAAAEAKAAAEAAQAEADARAKELMALKPQEHVLIVCGAKGGGKSTFVTGFLNPTSDKAVKPTTALEYSFGRKARGTVKDVVHVWELGGGLKLKDMLTVPITPANVSNVAICITLDLAEPGQALTALQEWLGLIRAQTTVLLKEFQESGEMDAKVVRRLEKKSKLRVVKAADRAHIDPTTIPVVVVCTKMDVFHEQATNKRKALFNALRYHAHVNGASIIAVSRKDKTQGNFLRGILNHYAFGNPFKSTTILESSKAIVVPAGADSFESIGLPGGCDSPEAFERMSPAQQADAWKKTAEEFFETVSATPVDDDDDDNSNTTEDLNLNPEPVVDAMVKQKEEELAKYRKEAERKRRLAAKDPKKSRSSKSK